MTTGPFSKSEDFIGSLTNFVTCNPGKKFILHNNFQRVHNVLINSGFCFCKDAPDVEVDIRMQMVREVMDLCPRGEMDRCLCRDDDKIHFPFTIMDIMTCEPKRVGNKYRAALKRTFSGCVT